MADFLDGEDTIISKLWDVLLQILGNDGEIPQDLPLDLPDSPKGDFGGPASLTTLSCIWVLRVLFGIGQDVSQASLTHAQLFPDPFQRNVSLPQLNGCPSPFGKLAVD